MPGRDDISEAEIRDRVIYALFLPAVRVARAFGVPLGSLKAWLETAYYQETQRKGLKGSEVARLMDVSTSKVSLLARQLRETFVTDEVEASLPRRIEFMLWAEPLTRARLKQVLTDVDAAAVDQAVDQLVDGGRITADDSGRTTVYRLAIDRDRRAWDTWLARIDGLNDALGNVSDAVYARFFDQAPTAFARTLSFRLRRRALGRLRTFYEEQLFPLILELDAEAGDAHGEGGDSSHTGGAEDAMGMRLSMFWAPYDYIDEAQHEDEQEAER